MLSRAKIIAVFFGVIVACALAHAAVAQNPLTPPAPAAVVAAPADALGRGTPKSMIQGFLKAVGAENYEQAASYLDLRNVPSARQKGQGADLARGLQTLLDQGGSIEADSKLSDSADGNQNDGLDPKFDLVGTIRTRGKAVDVLAERHDEPEVGAVWQFSKDTVAAIPALMEEMATGPLDRLLPDMLIVNKWYGVPVGHWLAIVTIAGISLLLAWALTFVVVHCIRRVSAASRTGHASHVLGAIVLPIRIYIAFGIFVVLARTSGISIVARQNFTLLAEIAAWLSLWWFLWRIIDIITESVQERMVREMRRSALSSVVFFRRSSRTILAVVAIALVMTRMGLDISAWFAALGIGGLALAFGAQKTIENFVVGLTLIIDQPLRIGDFCKIGGFEGTVEDIGMRSTRLKTQDMTTISIPNGMLASLAIENYALRTRFWFHPTLNLRYETTEAQLREILVKLRELLNNHPLVEKQDVRARFVGFRKGSLDVEMFAVVIAKDQADFLRTQEEMLLLIMKIIDECGSGFAFPSQTVYMAQDAGLKKTS